MQPEGADTSAPIITVETLFREHPTSSVRLRGRVRTVSTLRLRDASGEVQLQANHELDLGDGWLCELEGRWGAGVFDVSSVLWSAPTQGDLEEHEAQYGRLGALRTRHRIRQAVRAFFDEDDFLEVETPLMVPSPGLDLHLDAFEVLGGAERRWLITSPEYQMKRVLAGGAPRIYQLARCFRRSEQGSHHEPEFTMCEWYRTHSGSDELMSDTEQLVAFVARAVLGTTMLPCGVDVAPPWPRRTVRSLFAQHGLDGVKLAEDEERFFRAWVETIEPSLGDAAVFVTEWPAQMASLARLLPSDPQHCDRFEAYVGGLELCNGFGELVDPVEQEERLVRDVAKRAATQRPAYPIDPRFLAALRDGLPPSGGNALGLDRLVLLISGANSLQDVMAIPAELL